MLEKEIENSLRLKMSESGWVHCKNWGSMANFGRPDLYACHPDHGQWWIEMKKPGGKLGAKQFAWMMKFAKVGCPILVWDNDDLDALVKVMRHGRHGLPQWEPWMTAKQKREAATGRTSLDDALEEWGS